MGVVLSMVGVSLALPQDRWKAERDACGIEEYIITRAQAKKRGVNLDMVDMCRQIRRLAQLDGNHVPHTMNTI